MPKTQRRYPPEPGRLIPDGDDIPRGPTLAVDSTGGVVRVSPLIAGGPRDFPDSLPDGGADAVYSKLSEKLIVSEKEMSSSQT